MSRAADRARGERAVFRLFAEAAGFPVRKKSIRSRPEPEPDIRCTVGDKPRAFELCEVVNPALAERTNQSYVLRHRFAQAYGALPETERLRIESALGGRPAVFAAFRVSPGKWPQAIPHILDLLAERAEQLVHGLEIPVWQIANLKDMVLEMEVQRASSGRAALYAGEMTEVVDRTLALLQKKFKRRYRTSAPIELVAYYISQPPPTTGGWLSEVNSFIIGNLGASPFQRVWLFDHFSQTIRLVLPPYSIGQG